MSETELQNLITKENIRETVKSNFRYLRTELGLSQEKMGAKIGETRQNYASVEDGKNIAVQVIVNMAKFCNISLDNILLNDLSKQS